MRTIILVPMTGFSFGKDFLDLMFLDKIPHMRIVERSKYYIAMNKLDRATCHKYDEFTRIMKEDIDSFIERHIISGDYVKLDDFVSKDGYMMEVDLENPESLHEKHNDYPNKPSCIYADVEWKLTQIKEDED